MSERDVGPYVPNCILNAFWSNWTLMTHPSGPGILPELAPPASEPKTSGTLQLAEATTGQQADAVAQAA